MQSSKCPPSAKKRVKKEDSKEGVANKLGIFGKIVPKRQDFQKKRRKRQGEGVSVWR